MDAITIQILRNKVASLVDEMHYHFYRSGYSTIIRESRDFSCVILDRDGRLIVAPPMFFHAPVYRHLVGRILAVYGGGKDGRTHRRRRRVRVEPSLRGRPAARLRHGVRRAGVRRRRRSSPSRARSPTRPTSAARSRARPRPTRPRSSTRACCCRRSRSSRPERRRPTSSASSSTNSRQPELVRGDMHAQIAVTQMGAARVKELCGRFGAATVTGAFAAILKGAADELRAAIARLPEGEACRRRVARQRRGRARQAAQARRHGRDQGRHRELRLLRQRSAGARSGQPAARRWSRPACSTR